MITKLDFACKCCGALPPWGIYEALIMALNEIYKEVPFVISSGYRCHANNVANGGAKYSPHLFGWAADCVVPTIEQKKVFIDAVKQICHNPGIGQYANYPRLVHVDMTPIQRPAEWTK